MKDQVIGQGAESYTFDAQSIFDNAPSESGVYALLRDQRWVYIGETQDIHERLFQHLRTDNECLKRNAPNLFQFEICPENERVQRQDALIHSLNPACTERMG
jgi:predicted GIY-YIG superfamily endonuclease